MIGAGVLSVQGPPANPSTFISNTDDDRADMLRAIGVEAFDDLIADIPETHRIRKLKIPSAAAELDLAREIETMAAKNNAPGAYACFLGGGAYRHFIPAVAKRMAARGEFLTSYTPYQPEVAQGTLQVAFEFQTMVSLLMGLEAANAGMYDGPSAFAEGALMACRITRRKVVAILDSADGRNVAVLRSYAERQGIRIVLVSAASPAVPEDAACLMFQSPNALGMMEDGRRLAEMAHDAGALAVAQVNPTSLALFKSPGELDVDIATAEGQALGVPLSYGGPYVGLFACKEAHRRQMPGRIVGRTKDTEGRVGYVLTLQTREQHIRRERATSNICTSTQLIALMVAAYVAALGKQGLKRVAELCYHKAHYAAERIGGLDGYTLATDGVFFNEFPVSCPKPPVEINRTLLERGVLGGLDVSDQIQNGMLICVTEMNSKDEIDRLVRALDEIGAAA